MPALDLASLAALVKAARMASIRSSVGSGAELQKFELVLVHQVPGSSVVAVEVAGPVDETTYTRTQPLYGPLTAGAWVPAPDGTTGQCSCGALTWNP